MAGVASNKKTDRKQQILHEAAHGFMQHGYTGTSMRSLAAALGMEAPSLYNHIKGKQELLRQICFGVAHRFMAQLTIVEQSEASIPQKIELILRFHVQQMQQHFAAVYVSNRDWKHLQAPHLADFLQIRRQYEGRLASMVEAGVHSGLLQPIDSRVAVLGMLSAIRAVEVWKKHPAQLSPQRFEDNLVQLLVCGLVAPTK
ncbi:MAG: TetR/AcrR family transcriptional regulator [Bacteroidetes bacterium]|nr:MAG: TetR/AcrR family transcriptional regulator [Bacteroidota bacterium]